MTRPKVAVRRKVVKNLSRERVLAAAIELADQEGIDGLSMRRLAQVLGVEAMSLYHWFPNKDELLGAMIDAVFAEMARPDPQGDWRISMRAAAIDAHHVLLRHAWAAKLIGRAFEPGLGQVGWMDSILGRLRAGGLSAELTHHAYHAIDSHIVGFTLWVLPYIELTQTNPDFADQVIAQLPMADLPNFAEHVEYHLNEEQTGTSEFDFGLDLLLDGLERLRTDGRRRAPG